MAENPRIEELRRRVEADPASIAFAALAEEYRRSGAYDDAIRTCRTGLQRHPSYLSARVTLGRALIEIGDYDGARQELEAVLKTAPENLAALRAMGDVQERTGQRAPQSVPAPRSAPIKPSVAPPAAPKPEAGSPPSPLKVVAAPHVDSAPQSTDTGALARLESLLGSIQAAREPDSGPR